LENVDETRVTEVALTFDYKKNEISANHSKGRISKRFSNKKMQDKKYDNIQKTRL